MSNYTRFYLQDLQLLTLLRFQLNRITNAAADFSKVNDFSTLNQGRCHVNTYTVCHSKCVGLDVVYTLIVKRS